MLRWLLVVVLVVGCKSKSEPPAKGSAVAPPVAVADAIAIDAAIPSTAVDAAIPSTAKPMTGTAEEIPLIDLLQLLSVPRKSGTLVLEKNAEHEYGELHIREGNVVYAMIHGSDMAPIDAAYRILGWQTGHFEMKVAVELAGLKLIDTPTPELTMEATRRLDAARARD